MSEKQQHNNILLAVLGLVAVIVVVGLIGFFTLGKTEEIIQGEVEVSEFRVSCKLPGRVTRILVEEGQFVHKGDTLAVLEIPEATAQQKVAEATEGAVSALSSLADSGTRKEMIETAQKVLETAMAAHEIAQKTFTRINNLYEEGVVSAQRRDEAEAALKATTAQVEGARSQLDMARNGLRSQEKEAAHKQVEAARSAVEVVSSMLKETVQIAAVDGEVSAIYPKVGELVGLGSPIMSISIMSDIWGVFNIREDQLNGLKKGDSFTAYVPAFDKNVELKVSHIKDEGSYAVWKATKTNGQYDLKTFEVKAKPTQVFEGLRPGMSLIIKK